MATGARPAVGSSAGPHGAIVAPYGRVAPPPKQGFNAVGTGRGGWLYVPHPAGPPRPAGKPFTVQSPTQPPDPPLGGGHYTKIGPNQYQLIHAVGPNQWAPGPNPSARAGVDARSGLLQPGRQLSGQDLFQAAQALANAQTQGPIAELNQQIGQNNRQAQGAINQVGQFYTQLGKQAGQGVTDEQNIAGGLNTQLGQIGSQEQAALQGIGQNAASSLLKYAPQSDSSNSLASPALQALQGEIARQQGLAAQGQGAQRSFGATQGANFGSLAASNLGTFGLSGQAALRGIAQDAQVKNEPLNAKIAAERASYGADLRTALGQLRQQEISNTIANTGLGIKEQANLINQNNNIRSNQTSSQNNVRTNQTSSQNNQRTNQTSSQNNQRNNDPSIVGSPAWARVQNANGQSWSQNPNAVGSPAWARTRSGGGGARPLTTQENAHYFSSLGQVEQLIQDGHAKGGSTDQVKAALQSGNNPSKRSFDPEMIEAALELLGYGSINQTTANRLKAAGVNVAGGSFRGKPIKVTANFQPGNPTQVNAHGFAF